MKLTLLTLALASATSSAFVPPHKLAQVHSLKSTMSPSSVVGTEKNTIGLNEEKFLADMDQALNELKPKEEPTKKKKRLFRVPMDPIPADPMYVTQARMRIAALADRADERIEHFAWESKELKNKSVFDSFKSTYVAPPTVRYVKADATLAAAVQVESVSSTTSTNTGGGWIAGLALVLAGASIMEPTAVTDFVGNMNFDLDLSDLHLNMDLTAIQEQLAATKDTALSMQSGQTLASQDFISSAPSVVASTEDDLKAMLMEMLME